MPPKIKIFLDIAELGFRANARRVNLEVAQVLKFFASHWHLQLLR